MNITCPRCTARYVVDPAHFGRAVRLARCSNCGHVWDAQPDAEDPHAVLLGEPPAPRSLAAAADVSDDQDRDLGRGDHSTWSNDDDFDAPPSPSVHRRPVEPEEPPAATAAAATGEAYAADDDADLELALSNEGDAVAADAETWEEAPIESPSPPQDFAADAEAAAKKRTRRRLLVIVGAAVGTLLLCLAGLFAAQGPITEAIPGMAALYYQFGLAPPPPGSDLDIGEVTSSREMADGEDVLIVTGMVTNTAEDARIMPPLRVTLFDAADREVQETIVEPEKTMLAPHEQVRFNVRIASPASTARRMVVSFDTLAAEAS